MHNFQSFIKNTRESKQLERKTIADAINLSEKTITVIEEGDNSQLLQSSSNLLKNQIRRYCEYLEVSEKKIVSILNKIDILHYKKSRYGKLKIFDYVNRLAIIIIAIAIIALVIKHVKENMDTTTATTVDNSKSAIIYTPINYEMNNDGEQTEDSSYSNHQQKSSSKKLGGTAHPPATANMSNIVIDDDDSSNVAKKKDNTVQKSSSKHIQDKNNKTVENTKKRLGGIAHPPATANMNNIVIDEPDSSNSSDTK